MASEVSRNLQADKYISNSGWEKFTGPFLSWAPRTTLASLSRARIKADKTVSYFRRRKQGSFSRWRAAYFETSLSNSKVFSRRVNMRILNGVKKRKTVSGKNLNDKLLLNVSRVFERGIDERERTSSVTMIGQRDVRCCDEMRSRRTRNMRKIWAETAGLGFIRKVSVRRSARRGSTI